MPSDDRPSIEMGEAMLAFMREELGPLEGVEEFAGRMVFARGQLCRDELGTDIPTQVTTLEPLYHELDLARARREGALSDGPPFEPFGLGAAADPSALGWRVCPSDEWRVSPAGWHRLRRLFDSPAEAVGWIDTSTAAAHLGVQPETLRQLAREVPSTITGGPIQVGSGGARRHLRWRLATVEAWLREAERVRDEADQQRQASVSAGAPRKPRRRHKRDPAPGGSLLARVRRED